MGTTLARGSAVVVRLAKTARALDERIAFLDCVTRSAGAAEAWRLLEVDPFAPGLLGLMPDVHRTRVDILLTARKAIDEYLVVANSSDDRVRAAFLLGMSAAWVNLWLVGPEQIQPQQQRVLEAINALRMHKATNPSDQSWMLTHTDPFAVLPRLLTPTQIAPDEALSEYLVILREKERCLRALL